MKKEKLISKVVSAIKHDIENGNLSQLEELLSILLEDDNNVEYIEGYISEELKYKHFENYQIVSVLELKKNCFHKNKYIAVISNVDYDNEFCTVIDNDGNNHNVSFDYIEHYKL